MTQHARSSLATTAFALQRPSLGLALNDEDGDWVETQCWQLADHPDSGVRGTAGLCLGHIARRFRHVRRQSWSIVRRLCNDESVDNRPCDALDDPAEVYRT
jgi:hypothetical protein